MTCPKKSQGRTDLTECSTGGWNEPEVCFCSGFLNRLQWGGGSFEIRNVSGVPSLRNREDHLRNPVTKPREVKFFAQGHTAC